MVEKTFEEKKIFINEHFVYEVERMIQSNQILMNNKLDVVLNDLILESFLLHVRNLIEFFYYSVSNEDTANAEHYYLNWKFERPNRPDWSKDDRLNKEISHLSYARLKVLKSDKLWNINNIYLDLRNITKIFLSKINKDYFDDNLVKLNKDFK